MVVGAGILLTLAAGVGDLVSVLSALEAHSADCPGQTNSFPLSSPLHTAQPAQYAALQWTLAILTQDDPG